MLFPEKPLPEEVTELILLCLPFPVLRETVPFVCKSWAECVQVDRVDGVLTRKATDLKFEQNFCLFLKS